MNAKSSGADSSLADRQQALSRDLGIVDATMRFTTGPEQAQLAQRKTAMLREMAMLWNARGCPEEAQYCEGQRLAHMTQFPVCASANELYFPAESAGVARRNFDAGAAENAADRKESEGTGKKRKNDVVAKSRLANVAPVTAAQINDKKVVEKLCQVDRGYTQLETMTTATTEEGKNFPRQNSILITITECRRNVGGGNRTGAQFAKGKRRYRRVLTVRTGKSSMMRDGTFRRGLAALVEVMRRAEVDCKGDTERYWEIMQKRCKATVEANRYVLSATLDWETQQELLFGDELDDVEEEKKEEEERRPDEKSGASMMEDLGTTSLGVPYASAVLTPPPVSSLAGMSSFLPHLSRSPYTETLPRGVNPYGSSLGADIQGIELALEEGVSMERENVSHRKDGAA